MVSISNVDLVMAALRSRLRQVSGEKRADKAGAVSAAQGNRSGAPKPIEALAALRQLPPDEFERALVRVVLESELGDAISADPRFNSLVDRTHRTLQGDPELRQALQRIQLGED